MNPQTGLYFFQRAESVPLRPKKKKHMKPAPVTSLFSPRRVISNTVARYGQILHNTYRSFRDYTNEQIIFYFKDVLMEASIIHPESGTNRIVFTRLRGLSDTVPSRSDNELLNDLYDSFKERLEQMWPWFKEGVEISFSIDKTPEGKAVLNVCFTFKYENK